MKKAQNKRQLRRCACCQKVGHNKATCQEKTSLAQDANKPTANQPLNFFVHHVDYEAHPSTHVIDLKNQNIWRDIKSCAPDNTIKKYQNYHQDQSTSYQKHNTANNFNKPNLTELLKQLNITNEENILNFEQIIDDQSNKKPSPSIPKKQFCPSAKIINEKNTLSFQPHKLTLLAKLQQNFSCQRTKIIEKISKQSQNVASSAQNATANFYSDTLELLKKYFPLRRTFASIIIFSLIIFTPTQAQTYYQSLKLTANNVTNNGTAGFLALKNSTSAILEGDISNAQSSLLAAVQNFDQAVTTLDNNHRWLQAVVSVVPIVNNEVQSRQNLINVGHNISLGNAYLLSGLTEIQTTSSSTPLTKNINGLISKLQSALPYYQEAASELENIKPEILPANYQASFKDFKTIFTAFVNDLDDIIKLNYPLQEIFGGQGLRRYLLIFQNPNEIRATGGFMGSFAELDVKDGKIIKMEIPPGGTYDVQGQLNEYLEPPTPLLLINNRWEFQDANWFPDFPTSAEKILWFYRHSRNVTVDGVIAINAEVLNRILNITGPMVDNKRQLTLSTDNALATIQKVVEYGEEKTLFKPKQIITDLAPKFIEYFKNVSPKDVMPVLTNLQEALGQKEIQMYFTDTKTQQAISNLGWSGELLKTKNNQDYLLVVNTNINGQKSDAKIQQTIDHQSEIQKDGSIIDTVTITRTHLGEAGEQMYGQPNFDYIRIYVPQNSELINAGGFTWPDERLFKAPKKWYKKDLTLAQIEKTVRTDNLSGTKITDEFGKTSFGNWLITNPGQSSQVLFSYRLPFKVVENNKNNSNKWLQLFETPEQKTYYQLAVQRQSGINSGFKSQIIFPEEWSSYWQEGNNIKPASNGAFVGEINLDKDQMWSVIMTK